MSETLLIARREFTERLRDRAFLLVNAFILVAVVAVPLLVGLLAGGEDAVRLGAVGSEGAAVAAVAERSQDTFGVDLEVSEVADRPAAEDALRAEEVDAVVLDARTVLVRSELPSGLEPLLATAVAGVAPPQLDVEALEPPEEFDFGPAFFIGLVGVGLLYGLLFLYGMYVAQGIVEEKTSRVVEVVLSAVRPSQLLLGKILGLGALGFVQVLLVAGLGLGAALVSGLVDLPASAYGTVALVVAWYVLGYALYAALFAIAGALCSRIEDLQSSGTPVYILLVGALFIAQFTAQTPGSSWSRIAGIVPFTAPLLQPLRTAAGASEPWEVGLAIVLTVATIALLVPLAARFYRGGVLQVRRKIGLREAWRGAGG